MRDRKRIDLEAVIAILLIITFSLGLVGGFALIYESFGWFAQGIWWKFYVSFLGGIAAICVSGFFFKSVFTFTEDGNG